MVGDCTDSLDHCWVVSIVFPTRNTGFDSASITFPLKMKPFEFWVRQTGDLGADISRNTIDNLPQRLVVAHRLFRAGVTPIEFLLFHEEMMAGYLQGSRYFSVLNF